MGGTLGDNAKCHIFQYMPNKMLSDEFGGKQHKETYFERGKNKMSDYQVCHESSTSFQKHYAYPTKNDHVRNLISYLERLI